MTIDRFFASPFVARIVLCLVIAMSVVLAMSVGYRAGHHQPRTHIEPCAMVLTREHGPQCL